MSNRRLSNDSQTFGQTVEVPDQPNPDLPQTESPPSSPAKPKRQILPSEPALAALNTAARAVRKLKTESEVRFAVDGLAALFPAKEEAP